MAEKLCVIGIFILGFFFRNQIFNFIWWETKEH